MCAGEFVEIGEVIGVRGGGRNRSPHQQDDRGGTAIAPEPDGADAGGEREQRVQRQHVAHTDIQAGREIDQQDHGGEDGRHPQGAALLAGCGAEERKDAEGGEQKYRQWRLDGERDREEIPPPVKAVAAEQVRGMPGIDVIVHLPETVEELRGGHGKRLQRMQQRRGNLSEDAALLRGVARDVLGHGAEGEAVGSPNEDEGDRYPRPVALLARAGMQQRDGRDADGQEQHGGEFGEDRQGQSDAEEDGAAQATIFEPQSVGEERGANAGAGGHVHGGHSGVRQHGRNVGEEEDGCERAPIAEQSAAP